MNNIKTKTMKVLNDFDTKKMIEMFQQFDKNFVTLSTNQIYIQENQVEFEAYLKDIQNKLSSESSKTDVLKDIVERLKRIEEKLQ